MDCYMKLIREVLDHLHSTYEDYRKEIDEKLRFFANLAPGCAAKFNTDDSVHLSRIIPGIVSANLLFTEVQLMKDEIDKCSDVAELVQLLKRDGHAYYNLSLAYTFLLTLPLTVATNERSFSKMKIVKNSLRSSLVGDQFENVVLCAIESDLLNNIDLGSLANDWTKVKNGEFRSNQSIDHLCIPLSICFMLYRRSMNSSELTLFHERK